MQSASFAERPSAAAAPARGDPLDGILPEHVAQALRLVWMLRFVEGCELLEVAEQCGCSLSTTKRQIQRADARLRARLGTSLLPARTSDD